MYQQFVNGFIEVICGCAFSGKSEELIRRVKVLQYSKAKVQVFKPAASVNQEILSHDNNKIACQQIKQAKDILSLLEPRTTVVAIDEGELFDPNLVAVCEYLANKGIRVIVATLDQDCWNEPFSHIGELLSKAEFITKLNAVCVKCGNPASRTQMMVDNQEITNKQEVDISKKIYYEPRCRHCHQVN